MADPLSISASIIAVLQLTATVIQYLNDAKGTLDDVRSILIEISNTSGYLYSLRDLAAVDESWLANVKSLAAPSGPLEQFKSALEDLIRRLSPAVGLKNLGRKMAWPFQKGEVKEILGKIERQKMLFSLALQSDNIHLSRSIQKTVLSVQHDLTEITHGVRSIKLGFGDFKVSEEKVKIKEIIQWLSAPDPSTNHNTAHKKHESETGTWLLESESFESWIANANQVLWIHEMPGCGKTVLCSTIIDHVKSLLPDRAETGFAYFYADFNEERKQTVDGFLRSMIVQLSSQKTPFPEEVVGVFNEDKEENTTANKSQLIKMFPTLVKSYKKIYLIIDALDEFSEREDMLGLISEITAYDLAEINILVTSRNERDIKTALEGTLTEAICIQSAKVDDDIRLYVRSCLSSDAKLKTRSDPIKTEIEKALLAGAQGMFRWVVCQLESLRFCLSPAAMRTALKSLPKTLDETYDRILRRIPEEYRTQALTTFQLLACSARPLVLAEVAEAVAVNTTSMFFEEEDRLFDPLDILSICSSLVTLSEDTMELRLAHYSVLEYLKSERIQSGPASAFSIMASRAQCAVAKICLIYLLHFNLPDSLSDGTALQFPLLNYAAQYWFNHAKAVAEDGQNEVNVLSERLFNTEEGSSFINWLRISDPDHNTRLRLEKSLDDVGSPFYYAIFLDLPEIASLLFDKGVDTNAGRGVLGTPLQVAAYRGHKARVQQLLDLGADVESWRGEHGTAIQAAAFQGNQDIVQLLVDAGAKLNSRSGRYCNALHAAVSGKYYARFFDVSALKRDHEAVVRLLINAGARIEREYSAFGGIVFLTVELHDEAILRLLIGQGADFKRGGQSYGYALGQATYDGDENMVRMLLEAGADINSWAGQWGTALQTAALRGRLSLVQLLLDAGANVKSTCGRYGCALHTAAREGHVEIVRLLLEKGADINAAGGWNSHRLQRSTRRELVERLVGRGAQDG